jgi:hypothetical protein
LYVDENPLLGVLALVTGVRPTADGGDEVEGWAEELSEKVGLGCLIGRTACGSRQSTLMCFGVAGFAVRPYRRTIALVEDAGLSSPPLAVE